MERFSGFHGSISNRKTFPTKQPVQQALAMQDYCPTMNVFQQITVQFCNHETFPPRAIYNVLKYLKHFNGPSSTTINRQFSLGSAKDILPTFLKQLLAISSIFCTTKVLQLASMQMCSSVYYVLLFCVVVLFVFNTYISLPFAQYMHSTHCSYFKHKILQFL